MNFGWALTLCRSYPHHRRWRGNNDAIASFHFGAIQRLVDLTQNDLRALAGGAAVDGRRTYADGNRETVQGSGEGARSY